MRRAAPNAVVMPNRLVMRALRIRLSRRVDPPLSSLSQEQDVAGHRQNAAMPGDDAVSYFSSAIGLTSTPTPSMSISQVSPPFMNTGGLRAKPTPDGVPVMMMSPGSSVMPWVT